jgi:hypothetical protein
MTPWEQLGTFLRALNSNVSVYDTPTEQMDAPCYVIVPGEPWIDPQGTHASFSGDEERYEVWAVALGAQAWDSVALIHAMLHAVRLNLPDGWFFESAGQFGQVDHAGATYFGAPLRLTYNNCGESESESS